MHETVEHEVQLEAVEDQTRSQPTTSEFLSDVRVKDASFHPQVLDCLLACEPAGVHSSNSTHCRRRQRVSCVVLLRVVSSREFMNNQGWPA